MAQVIHRVLVWWINPNRDLWPRDQVEVVFELRGEAEPQALALWLSSQKLGSPRAAVLYQARGDAFRRWYDEAGREIELRLKEGPIAAYEQVTSLLGDGRGHRGVDFKAPIGTPVLAPFDGTVTRKNWATRRNGLCLEVQSQRTGHRALFLHLDRIEPRLSPGARVRKGQVIAKLGNTGRSFAPHLHYQLELGARVIDPFRFHRTWRAEVPADERVEVTRALAKYEIMRLEST